MGKMNNQKTPGSNASVPVTGADRLRHTRRVWCNDFTNSSHMNALGEPVVGSAWKNSLDTNWTSPHRTGKNIYRGEASE